LEFNRQKQLATDPDILASKFKLATAEGAARANQESLIARGSNAALSNVPPHLITPATEAATKDGTEFASAKNTSDRLAAMMDAARAGNVLSYQLIPEEGTLQIFTTQRVHRVNRSEFEQYAGGGSAWQRLVGHVGKQLSGKSIAPSVLNDMADIQAIQAKGAKSRYENTLRVINNNFGSNFSPVEMSGLESSGGTVRMKAPNGQVKDVAPDEVEHYRALGAVVVQ